MWQLLIKNSKLQYSLFTLKILIFETSGDPWVQLQRRHHYFITFCTTTKKGKYKQTKIIWQNFLKWNSLFFSRSDLTTADHLHNWKRWTSSSSSALLGQHLSPFLVRVDDTVTKGWVALPNQMNFQKNFKRPSTTPLIFGKLCCNFFRKTSEKALYRGLNLQHKFLDFN